VVEKGSAQERAQTRVVGKDRRNNTGRKQFPTNDGFILPDKKGEVSYVLRVYNCNEVLN